MTRQIACLIFAALFLIAPARAEIDNCTEIVSLPTVITSSGLYCFKGNLSTAPLASSAIEIQADGVVVDLNNWELSGTAAGALTQSIGIYAVDRNNIVVRNGTITGFKYGVILNSTSAGSSGQSDDAIGNIISMSRGPSSISTSSATHLIENVRFLGNRLAAVLIRGSEISMLDNVVAGTNSGPNAFGVVIQNSRNILVQNNIITRTIAPGSVYGIFVSNSERIIVDNNIIGDFAVAPTQRGIFLTGVTSAVVKSNKIDAPWSGTNGILALGSAAVSCIGNSVFSFSTAIIGCNFSTGNLTN